MSDLAQQGAVLNQALPYIQRFRGQTFVVKYGGAAMREPGAQEGVIRNVLLLQLVGIRAVLVHGGGPEIDKWVERLGGEKQTVRGLRVTDDATMEVVEMALGRTNKALVTEVQRAGGKALGLSGRDGGLLLGEPIAADLGRVGRIVSVETEPLRVALDAGFLPVVCTVAADAQGRGLNVNADSAAAAIAVATGASKLILLSDTDGVLRDVADPATVISELTTGEAQSLIDGGAASRGMVPKLEAAIEARRAGVPGVHLIHGARPNALLLEVLTDAGIGTMVR